MSNDIAEIFPAFTDEELRQQITDECTIRRTSAGTTLMEMGQYVKSIPLITEGRVKVFREDDDGHELFLYYLEPGEGCAMSFACTLHNQTSQVKAVAMEDTEFISVPVGLIPDWMSKYKSWYRFVIETYQARFEELLSTPDSIAFQRMDERLISYLKKSSEVLETRVLKLPHQEIAYELNTSREVISRLLKKIEKDGFVSLGRNRIEPVDL
ncbi:MAG: Crp/Fnr family transcriptional regulator [Flavobacteriales bacterium]|nr:Crp/Fnr family transcriptional regulator [Flavobacteriales bacterium]